MKKTNFFYHALIVLAMCGFMFCGGEGTNSEGTLSNDDSTRIKDSMNAVHHVDPANAFPQPPVTGSDQDSTRSKDSMSRPNMK